MSELSEVPEVKALPPNVAAGMHPTSHLWSSCLAHRAVDVPLDSGIFEGLTVFESGEVGRRTFRRRFGAAIPVACAWCDWTSDGQPPVMR